MAHSESVSSSELTKNDLNGAIVMDDSNVEVISETDVPISMPIIDLPINTHDGGFYDGLSREVTLPAKAIVAIIIMWAIFFPVSAGKTLSVANSAIIANFAGWYTYLVGGLVIISVLLAAIPQLGSLRIGAPGEKPEFSRFSWTAMLFGAGIGIGMLTYSVGEPMAHFSNNPQIITGDIAAGSAAAVRPAYVYTFMHYGLGPWCTYAMVGLAVGYVAHRRSLPLTIRSALTPLFGKRMSGLAGHGVDVVAVVATILGVAVTMGLGVQQFIMGLHRIGVGDWLLATPESASAPAIILALLVLVGASTLSALSGIGRGIKWLSNINLALSIALLALFAVVGAGFAAWQFLAVGLWDYLVNLPANSFTVFRDDGTTTGAALVRWQLDWPVFYWAWWIAFAPFVGLFIARISRGRTIREYMLGVVALPALICFVWMTLVGGTAIQLELDGIAQGAIMNAGLSDQLYATIAVLLSPDMALVVSGLIVVLLMTYLITSVDSAILIINTINGGGDHETASRFHIVFWGAALAIMVGGMLILGGIDAIRITMIIGALPFSFVVAMMAASIVKAVVFDLIRKHYGVPTTAQGCEEWDGVAVKSKG